MIPVVMHRRGLLTYNTVVASPFFRWQHEPYPLVDRVTPYGLLFAHELGAFGVLKEEITRNKPRKRKDPVNSADASGILVDGEGKLYAAHWRDDPGSHDQRRINIISLSDSTWFQTPTFELDEIGGVAINERPDWTNEQVIEFVTKFSTEHRTPSNLPIETKSLEELAAFYREVTGTQKEAIK